MIAIITLVDIAFEGEKRANKSLNRNWQAAWFCWCMDL
jgi:hypothetical protein